MPLRDLKERLSRIRALRLFQPSIAAPSPQKVAHGRARFRDRHDDRQLAILQVSPGIQPNGAFVNYGDELMHFVMMQLLEENGFIGQTLLRERVAPRELTRQRATLFIDMGGFIYSGAHHKGMRAAEAAAITVANADAAKRGGAMAVAAPQTFGPFRTNGGRTLDRRMKRWLATMDRVFVRDEVSLAHLEDLSPKHREKCALLPDVGLLYIADPQPGAEWLARVREGEGTLVGVIPNRQIHTRDSSYVSAMATLIEHLKVLGATVILIPHETGRFGHGEEDDQFLCDSLSQMCNVLTLSKNLINKTYSHADEVNYIARVGSILANLDFLVSCRFHGCVRGIAERIPTVALSWAHKYPALYHDVGLSPDEFILGATESAGRIDLKLALEKLEKAWYRRAETATQLHHVIPDVQERVRTTLSGALAAARDRSHHQPASASTVVFR